MVKAKFDVIVIEPVIFKDFLEIQNQMLVQNNNSILILKKLETKQLKII